MTDPNTLNEDVAAGEVPTEGVRMPMQPSAELTKLLQGFKRMQEAILQDKPVTAGAVRTTEESLTQQILMIGNESLSIEQLRADPRVQKTLEIIQDLEQGTLENENSIEKLIFLSDRAAEILVQKGKPLHLQKIRWVTDHQVAVLSQLKGQFLQLGGVTSLTDAQAASFGQSEAKELCFNSLKSLTDAQAASIGAFRGTMLSLHLTTLTDAQAESIGAFGGRMLNLSSLTVLTDAQATALSRFKGDYLHLGSVRQLTDAQAASLALWGRGNGSLNLAGLETMSDAQAASLGAFGGRTLYLEGIKTLSDEQAAALAAFKGHRILFTTLSGLSAKALESLHGIYDKIEGKHAFLATIRNAGSPSAS